jgi:hypothetical protein
MILCWGEQLGHPGPHTAGKIDPPKKPHTKIFPQKKFSGQETFLFGL